MSDKPVLSALLERILSLRLDRFWVLQEISLGLEVLVYDVRSMTFLGNQPWLESAGRLDLLLFFLDSGNGHDSVLFSVKLDTLMIEPVKDASRIIWRFHLFLGAALQL